MRMASWCAQARAATRSLITALLLAGPCSAALAQQDGDLDSLFEDPAAAGDASGPGDDEARPPELADNTDVPVITLDEEAPPTVRPARRVIEEIVVTAQKTEQGLRDVPISISAIGGEQIKEAAITDPGELVQYTPNVKFSAGIAALTSVTIRGFGTPPFARGIEPSVGLVIDDVFYGRSTFTNDGIFDLERLEVLRGPQGTLFGKNTVAGLLNFTTAEPDMEELQQNLTGAVSRYDGLRVEGALSLPIQPGSLAGRLAFRARRQDSGIRNTTREQDEGSRDLAARLKLRWLPSDWLSADLMLFAAESETRGIGLQLSQATERTLRVAREHDPETEDDAFDNQVATNSETFSGRDSRSVALKLTSEHERLLGLNQASLSAILNYATVEGPFLIDIDSLPIRFLELSTDGPERYRQQTAELRLTGHSEGWFGLGERMDWIGGLFYAGNSFDVTQFSSQLRSGFADFARAGGAGLVPENTPDGALTELLVALGIPPGPLLTSLVSGVAGDNDEEVVINILSASGDAYAAFVQTTWFLGPRLSAVIGLRLGQETKQALQSSQGSGVLRVFGGQQNFENRGRRRESEFTPKLALSYELNDEITLFGNLTKGFKSGGFSGPLVAPTNLEFEPESAISTELGVKSRLLEGSLLLNATAFRVQFDNLQLNLFDGVNIATLNAASATAYGLELDFQWLPRLPFLSLAGSLGFTDVRYERFPCGPARVDQQGHEVAECEPDSQGVPTPDRRVIRPAASQDLSGKTLPFAPRLNGTLTPSLRLPLIPSRGIGALIGVDLIYQGEQFLDADLDPAAFQPATLKINARLGMAAQDRSWSVLLNVKNITGEKEQAFVLDAQQLPNNFTAIPVADDPIWTLDFRYSLGQ